MIRRLPARLALATPLLLVAPLAFAQAAEGSPAAAVNPTMIEQMKAQIRALHRAGKLEALLAGASE